MTVTQKNTEGLIAFPFAGNQAGCGCYTFDTTATPAELARDSTLFASWETLMAALTPTPEGPVSVEFKSDAKVPAAGGPWRFPEGSKFTSSDFMILEVDSGAIIVGVAHITNMELDVSSTVFQNEPNMTLQSCMVNYPGGGTPPFSYTEEGNSLELINCDAMGFDHGDAYISITGGGSNKLVVGIQDTLLGPTVLGGGGGGEAYIMVLGFGARLSRAQPNFNSGGGSVMGFAGRPQALGGRMPDVDSTQGILDIGIQASDFTLGSSSIGGVATSPATCLQVGLLYIGSSTGGGGIKLILGPNATTFTPGQILTVVYQPEPDGTHAANQVTLCQPDGTAITFGPGTGNATIGGNGSGAHYSITLVADSSPPSTTTNLWTVLTAGPLL